MLRSRQNKHVLDNADNASYTRIKFSRAAKSTIIPKMRVKCVAMGTERPP